SNPAGTRGCDIADIVPSGAMLNCRRKFCTPFAPLPETPYADPPDGCIVIETIGPVPSTVGVGSGASEPSAATETCEMRVLPMAPHYAKRALGCRATTHGFFPAATSPAASGESEPSAATENCEMEPGLPAVPLFATYAKRGAANGPGTGPPPPPPPVAG